MKRGFSLIISGCVMAVGIVTSGIANNNTQLRDAIYKNCVNEIKNNNAVKQDTASHEKICNCVANDTLKSVSPESVTVFNSRGWNAFNEKFNSNGQIAKTTKACIAKINNTAGTKTVPSTVNGANFANVKFSEGSLKKMLQNSAEKGKSQGAKQNNLLEMLKKDGAIKNDFFKNMIKKHQSAQ